MITKAFLIVLLLFATPALAQDFVLVEGEVRTPGAIAYTSGMTLTHAVAAAGGFTKQANSTRVQLDRGQSRRTYNLNVLELIDPELRPGDIVTVAPRWF